MKRINSRCWEYKGFTILKEDTYSKFPYIIYDRFGFALVGENFTGFPDLDNCKRFIDKIYR